MASDQNFLSFVCDQMKDAGDISFRKMFGEYAIYKGEKVVALVCDNQLFVKPTTGGKALLRRPREAPPYPGAKPCYVIADGLDDPEFLSKLIATTARELPAPTRTKAKSQRKAVKKRIG
jgi:TfoX/Sxy family transcriptional regulator of competence genes